MNALAAHIIEIGLLVVILLLVLLKIPMRLTAYVEPTPELWLANEVFFIDHHLKTKGGIQMKQAQVDQKFNANWPAPKDKYGNETTVKEDSVQFSSDDETIATVEPDPDNAPYGCKIKTNSKTGATAIHIKARTADDSGELEGQLAVEVVAGDAVAFGEPNTSDAVDDEDEG
jgi:hypothetical protein